MEEKPALMAPKVSIVAGFYNRRDNVQKSVQSLLNQTFADFELLVFDDASTDGTLKELEKFQDTRMKLIKHPSNRGFVSGLIAAINEARGEYIAIHGAGDLSYPHRIQRQVEFLEKNADYVAVGCHREVLTATGAVVSRTEPGPEPRTFPDLVQRNMFSHGEVMYRKDAYLRVGGYRQVMKFAQDYDLWLRISKIGKLGVVQETLYGRVAFQDGASFDPLKASEQAAYASFARRRAQGEYPDEEAVEKNIFRNGIHAVVPLTDPKVLHGLKRRLMVLLSLGRWDDVRMLDRDILKGTWGSPVQRIGIRTIRAIGQALDPSGRMTQRVLSILKGRQKMNVVDRV